jgi:ribonucleoside-diphosphate reductase beta chain
MENIHSEPIRYLSILMLRMRKDELFNALEVFPAIKKKADWALKWIESDSFAERLIVCSS